MFLQKPFATAQFEESVAAARDRLTLTSAAAAPAAADTFAVLDEGIYAQLVAILPAAQLRDLYALTLSDVHSRIERMRSSLRSGDLHAVRREAHAIRGGAGMVGARELATLASAIETGSANDTPSLDDFARASDRLQRMLNERLPLPS